MVSRSSAMLCQPFFHVCFSQQQDLWQWRTKIAIIVNSRRHFNVYLTINFGVPTYKFFFLPNYFLCSISGVGLVCGRCLVMNIQLIAKTANVLIYACVAWRSFRIGSRWFVTCSFINLCEIKVRFTFTWLFGGVLYIWLYRGLFNQAVGKTWVADQAGGKMRICDSADVRILNM